MYTVKYFRMTISKEDLLRLSPLQRKRLVMFNMMHRDVSLLSKLILYVDNNRKEGGRDKMLGYADTMGGIFFLKTLISKLWEFWIFLDKNKILSELEGENFSQDLKQNIKDIHSFWSKESNRKLFKFIRDSFGFHYEYNNRIDNNLSKALDMFDHNEFQMFLTENTGVNDILPSLNTILLLIIFEEMEKLGFKEEGNEKVKRLFLLAGEAERLFVNFSHSYLIEILDIKLYQLEEIEVEVPEISTVRLPLIVYNNKVVN